ncbi:MAG: M61 family metallopeptidase [Bacteroidetes bacterium]|nr:M61 family metallopeptidase [Bacteroidota bacterium]
MNYESKKNTERFSFVYQANKISLSFFPIALKYIFSYKEPLTHLIDIEFIADSIKGDARLPDGQETTIQLPAWRPGRYELGNFAKNVKEFSPSDEKGNPLPFHKITKDCWKIQTKGVKKLHVKYSYYAVDLNAGSTYLDDKQLYVNPVNCCVYIPERINEACEVEIKIPEKYIVATSIAPPKSSPKGRTLHANPLPFGESWRGATSSYHELADSPFIASPTLQHNMFVMDGVEFNLWFQGECKPNWSKIINDFFIFINEQFVTMKGPIPSDEYHFIFQILPYRFHHGVEHLSSTVIAIGPSYEIMRGDVFLELLSVSSHELFHSWNIKAIRPAEMLPYDYTKENYSRLGFVAEGVTTYYGDFFLFRSGIYSEFEVNRCLSKHLQNHFDNFGRYNLSVADSSFDTWLDGYTEIVPHRKTSIYSEGCLIALMTDLMIRKYSNNERSLDDVMRHLYKEYGKKGIGYMESDYKAIIEKIAGTSFDEFFNNYVYKANSYENALIECLHYIGLELLNVPSKKYHERYYGFKVSDQSPVIKVTALYPNSVAEKSPKGQAGIQLGDEIISINGYPVRNNFAEWARYFGQSEVKLNVSSNGKVREIIFIPSAEDYFKIHYVQKTPSPTEEQRKNFTAWSKRRF